MNKTATLTKVRRPESSVKTGARVVVRPVWFVTDDATGRNVTIAKTQKLARDRARFAGYTLTN